MKVQAQIQILKYPPHYLQQQKIMNQVKNDESDDGEIYDVDLLQHDPGLRPPINAYDINERNSLRRGYIALGPCQPRYHDFPQSDIGGK